MTIDEEYLAEHNKLSATEINSIEIKNFKCISEATIPLSSITYLIGGNNSGKSSVLQAIHTAVCCAQLAIERKQKVIPESDLRYCPTAQFELLGHNAPYENSKEGSRGQVEFTGESASEPHTYKIEMYKARNHNNAGVELSGSQALRTAISNRDSLFSIYVPGLTGIPHREEYKSYSSVLKMAAGGEANLVLRNIIYHLSKRGKLDKLSSIVSRVFDDTVSFAAKFEEKEDLYIDVKLSIDGGQELPVDLWGTGVLQVTQIVAYALLFTPALLLIDEPDSHLHPSWQKTLAMTFRVISEELGCQIIVTTHSHHLLTEAPTEARVIWMKGGEVVDSDAKKLTRILLELGALDTFDTAFDTTTPYILYTEDQNPTALSRCIDNLHRRGRLPEISVIPIGGIKNTNFLAALDAGARNLKQHQHVILHRDRDCLTDTEIETWSSEYETGKKVDKNKTGQPGGQMKPMKVFIPSMTDTESYYCLPEHLSEALHLTNSEAQDLVHRVIEENEERLRERFKNKRKEVISSTFYPDGGVPSSETLWKNWTAEDNWGRLCGKDLLGMIKADASIRGRASEIERTISEALSQEILDFFAQHFPKE